MNMAEGGRKVVVLFGQFRERYCQARLKECTDPALKSAYERKLASIQQSFSVQEKDACKAELTKILDTAQESLSNTKFLAGPSFSLADILLTSLLVRLRDAGTLKNDLKSHPQIQSYFSQVQTRPSFKKTYSGSAFTKSYALTVFRDIPSLFWSKLTCRY
jgi:glutathione S-transferase